MSEFLKQYGFSILIFIIACAALGIAIHNIGRSEKIHRVLNIIVDKDDDLKAVVLNHEDGHTGPTGWGT